MTFLTKIKTLIEYAKYGMNFIKMLMGQTNHFEVPEKVESLLNNYYSFPSGITSVYGKNVKDTDIGFFRESNIERVDLPVLEVVSREAFQNCTSLYEINVPLAKEISLNSFENTTSLIYANFPNVESIADEAFYNSNIETIEAPKVNLIYNYAFKECYVLMTAYLPSVTDIRIGAFSSCASLTSLTLGPLTKTYTDSFEYCYSLTDLTVGEGTIASLTLIDTDLTQESLHSIIDNYADMTGKEAPTFDVGEYNLSKIDPIYLEKLERKNINYQ